MSGSGQADPPRVLAWPESRTCPGPALATSRRPAVCAGPASRPRQAPRNRHRPTGRHRRRPRRRRPDPRRDGLADQRLPEGRRCGPPGHPEHPSLRQGQSAETAGQKVDVLGAIPRVAPAAPGELLGTDRLGGAGPGLVDRAGLHRGECRLARLRPFRRHRKAAVAARGRGHLRPGAVDRRPAVERRPRRHARGVVPGHQPVRRRGPAAAGAAGDLPVGRLHRRVPRPDLSGRRSGDRLHPAVVAQRSSRHPADLRPRARCRTTTHCATTSGARWYPTCRRSRSRCWSAAASRTTTCTAAVRSGRSPTAAPPTPASTPIAAANGRPSTPKPRWPNS